MPNLLYLNTHAARYGWYFGRRMPKGYRLAARFWGSGLIDRTRTLYTGFPFEVLYPLPAFKAPGDSSDALCTLSSLCDQMGVRIVNEGVRSNRLIQVLWSGGIDSTAALVAVIKAAAQMDERFKFEILLSKQSIAEYPLFFQRFVEPRGFRLVSAPVTSHLDASNIIVTGEHGDQIFGSAKAARYVADGRAFDDFTSLPGIFAEALDSAADGETLFQYIEPLFYSCPIKLRTVFDAFWWINFALKWQIVGLRLAVFRVRRVEATFAALRHFFSHSSFQLWSLTNHDKKIQGTWESYKMPLKDYIFEFTGDDEYRRTKVKVPSLRAVLVSDTLERPPAYRVLMDEEFRPLFWRFDRNRRRGGGRLEIPGGIGAR